VTTRDGGLKMCPRCTIRHLDFDARRGEAVCLGTTCGFRQPVRDREEFEKLFGDRQESAD